MVKHTILMKMRENKMLLKKFRVFYVFMHSKYNCNISSQSMLLSPNNMNELSYIYVKEARKFHNN